MKKDNEECWIRFCWREPGVSVESIKERWVFGSAVEAKRYAALLERSGKTDVSWRDVPGEVRVDGDSPERKISHLIQKAERELCEGIAGEIIGECKTEAALVEEYDLPISEEDFVEWMLVFNVEHCDGCGRWGESCNFNEESGLCLDCDPEEEM